MTNLDAQKGDTTGQKGTDVRAVAEMYAWNRMGTKRVDIMWQLTTWDRVRDYESAFIAGATWQLKQDAETVRAHFAPQPECGAV